MHMCEDRIGGLGRIIRTAISRISNFCFFLSKSRDIYDIFGKKVVSCDGLGGLVYFRSRERCKSCAFGALLFTFFFVTCY